MTSKERVRTILVSGGALVLVGILLFAFARAFPYKGNIPENTEWLQKNERAPITLATTTMQLAGREEVLQIPEGLTLTVAMHGLGKARFMAMSPDNRLFVPDMVDYKLSHQGKLYVLDGFNPETGTFAKKSVYLSGLRGPNSALFYTDENGQDWLYVALTAHLLRYKYEPGDLRPSSAPEVVIEFPNTQTPGETSVVWHITRTIHERDGRIYIAVGSGCNSCEQVEGDMRGMIYSILPDGSDVEIYAHNIRNGVDFTWDSAGLMHATANGVDHLGTDRPDEVMYQVPKGITFGWPYCYESKGEIVPDTSQEWENPINCEDAPRSFASFPPRSAPLGIDYFGGDFHPLVADSFLVALHGSFEVTVGTGNQIVRVAPDGTQEVFMDGFLTPDGRRIIRVVDFLKLTNDSFFFSDDQGGRIFYAKAS